MPISGQISIEFGKLTIPHITCASCKSRGEYESIDVEIQDEKLPEKSADNKDESSAEGITRRKSYNDNKSNGYETTSAELLSLTAKEWMA
ncbi:hypothetical protein LOAG_16069, partial [Loa loa]